jgi:hypothetical protein
MDFRHKRSYLRQNGSSRTGSHDIVVSKCRPTPLLVKIEQGSGKRWGLPRGEKVASGGAEFGGAYPGGELADILQASRSKAGRLLPRKALRRGGEPAVYDTLDPEQRRVHQHHRRGWLAAISDRDRW